MGKEYATFGHLFRAIDRKVNACGCDHTYRATELACAEMGFSDEETANIISQLEFTGGYCDCEVLMNSFEQIESAENILFSVSI